MTNPVGLEKLHGDKQASTLSDKPNSRNQSKPLDFGGYQALELRGYLCEG